MCSWILGLLAATAIVAAPVIASASSLQIMPINIEVPAPGAASTVTLINSGEDTLNAQIRIFKWIQRNGKDELVPTKDVVTSPPAVKLEPGKKSVIRVVRLGKVPASAEETYRLIVDEVPKPLKPGQAGVGFSVRHSIPVFFSKPGQDVDLTWQAALVKGKLVLQADNAGGRRIRLASLAVMNGTGKTIRIGEGLAGYVLGQSSKQWTVNGASKTIAAGGTIKITAQGDNGPIEATAKVVAAN
ncbi:MAG: fimbrial biogenesis chaperone [Aestuariivirga sp.]